MNLGVAAEEHYNDPANLAKAIAYAKACYWFYNRGNNPPKPYYAVLRQGNYIVDVWEGIKLYPDGLSLLQNPAFEANFKHGQMKKLQHVFKIFYKGDDGTWVHRSEIYRSPQSQGTLGRQDHLLLDLSDPKAVAVRICSERLDGENGVRVVYLGLQEGDQPEAPMTERNPIVVTIERGLKASAEMQNVLQRLAEKVGRAEGLQYSGGYPSAEDWSELRALVAEARLHF